MNPQIEEILKEIPQHSQDPNWLADILVELSSLLYFHNTKTGEAELKLNTATKEFLITELPGGKNITITEAKVYGSIATKNEFNTLRLQGEAIIEVIQALKKKLEFLLWEKKNG